MKRQAVKSLLVGGNEDAYKEIEAKIQKAGDLQAFLLLCCQLADHIASGGDAYLTITANRKRTEYMITLGVDGEKTYVTAATLVGLFTAVPDLL